MPSAPAMLAMVLAVPMVLQAPALRLIEASASTNSTAVIAPAFTVSENFHRCVPDPTRSPRKQPFSIGPPDTRIAGISTLMALAQLCNPVVVTPVSQEVAHLLTAGRSDLVSLPVQEPILVAPCSLITLRDRRLSPVAVRCHDLLSSLVAAG